MHRLTASTTFLALALIGAGLAGCANLNRHSVPVEATQNDDDAYCRQSGTPGSDPYVACRKDRDHQRGLAGDRMERQHRNMAERMLNER
jgi:hypothetical protein